MKKQALIVLILTIFVTLVFSTTLADDAVVAIDATHFPDPIFREMMEEKDGNHDGFLSSKEIAWITSVDCYDYGLTSLKGIEYLTELTRLDCTLNELTSLDVSQNTALRYLHCSDNDLSRLDVSMLPDLKSLDCNSNNLKTLDVSNNPKLDNLSCYNNQLTSLDVSHNPKLDLLYCSVNPISALDVSQNTALRFLICQDNGLSRLDVSMLPDLKELDCGGNNLRTLDVSNNPKLEELSCYTNLLTKLDVQNNTALLELDCYNNQLKTLDITNNPSLKYLYCFDSKLTQLNISRCPALCDAYLHGIRQTMIPGTSIIEYGFENQRRNIAIDESVTILSTDPGQNEPMDFAEPKVNISEYYDMFQNMTFSVDAVVGADMEGIFIYRANVDKYPLFVRMADEHELRTQSKCEIKFGFNNLKSALEAIGVSDPQGDYYALVTLYGEGYNDALFKYDFVVGADVIMPASVQQIQPEAFLGSRMGTVKLPDGVKAIGDRAFASCSNLTSIYLPDSLQSISSSAFAGSDAVTIYGKKGSLAENYAKARNIPFVPIG